MLRSLLIGIDGTDDGGPALALGIDWAKRFHALAAGIGIVDELGVLVPESTLLAESYDQLVGDAPRPGTRHRVEEALGQFARRCEGAGVACQTLRAGGLAYEQILAEARNHDLTLLGQHTHFYERWEDRCDETLQNVVRASPRPVVVVPKAPAEGGSVVVAVDGSIQAARALEAFEATVLDRSRAVHVVSVAHDRESASRHADSAAESLRAKGINAHAHPVATFQTAAAVLLDEVRRLDAGLLVMGSYGQPVFREFFIGSVTRTVLKEGTVPIFCFR